MAYPTGFALNPFSVQPWTEDQAFGQFRPMWNPQQIAAIKRYISWTYHRSAADTRFYNQDLADAAIWGVFGRVASDYKQYLEGTKETDPLEDEDDLEDYWGLMIDLVAGFEVAYAPVDPHAYDNLKQAFLATLEVLFGDPDVQLEAEIRLQSMNLPSLDWRRYHLLRDD